MARKSITPEQKKFLKKVGENICKQRKAKRLSQTELGYRINVDKPHISRAESGSHNFSIITAMRFAEGLEIPIDKLFCFD